MKTWKYIVAVAMSLCVGACTDENVEQVEDSNVIRLEAVHPAQCSRVTDTNFENQDQIGLYMTKEGNDLQLGGNELNNEQFVFNGSSWSSRTLYWNKGKHDVYAYYPYTEEINNIEDFSFKVQTNQEASAATGKIGGYEASDFLWASVKSVAASKDPIRLKFSHRMSKMLVKLVKGQDYEGEIPDDVEVYIHNTVPEASIDLATGGVSKNEYAQVQSIKARKLERTLFDACLVPQQIMSKRPLVEVITQGVSYLLEGRISLKQGMQHTVQVTLSKNPEQTKIEIGGEIEDWTK